MEGPFIFPDLSNLFSHLPLLSLVTTISVLPFALYGKQSPTKEAILHRRSHWGIPPQFLTHPTATEKILKNSLRLYQVLQKLNFNTQYSSEITWRAQLSLCLTLGIPVFDLELH